MPTRALLRIHCDLCGREQRRQAGPAGGQRLEPNYLYINKGDGTFEDQSYVSGFALNNDGREIASMGLAVGDYMNNGLRRSAGDGFLRRLQGALSQRRRRELYRGWQRSGDRADSGAVCGLGRWVPRLRQRRLERHHDDQRPRLSAGGSSTTGERHLPSGRCCFAIMHNGKFEYVPPVKGSGLATLTSGRGAAFGDLFNNGKDRCGDQPDRWTAGAVEECESGSSSLGGVEAGGRTRRVRGMPWERRSI